MSSELSVVAVTCLALEARIAAGAGVAVICSHASQLVVGLEAAVRRGACGIISFGIAGGLAPDLVAGDWVIAAGVRTDRGRIAADHAWARRLLAALPGAVHADIVGVDAPVADPLEKRFAHARTGAAAVDMESHIAAKIAAAHGIPFAACRVVIDSAHRRLPPAALVGLRLDGTPDVGAVLGSLARQPGQLPALTRMALDMRIARSALRRGRRLLGAGLGFPYLRQLALDVA
jgi:adenosylhomocysteine nucleosidase